MQKLLYIVLISAFLMPSQTFAACDAKADGSTSYSEAEAFVYTLPEVKAWKKLVYAKPGRRVITLPTLDHQTLINGKCYWSVNLYEDTSEKVNRWNGFYIRVKDKYILVDDIVGGDPMTLKQWRSQLKRWDSNSSFKRGAKRVP